MLSSSRLYSKPSFLKGAARNMDMFGSLNNYNYSESEEEADLRALKRDWKIVGIDIYKAILNYAKKISSK